MRTILAGALLLLTSLTSVPALAANTLGKPTEAQLTRARELIARKLQVSTRNVHVIKRSAALFRPPIGTVPELVQLQANFTAIKHGQRQRGMLIGDLGQRGLKADSRVILLNN